MGEEVKSKFVLFLAILVVLVVTLSTWLLLNKLNTMEMNAEAPQAAAVYDTPNLAPSSQAGKVQMEILPPGGEGEIK